MRRFAITNTFSRSPETPNKFRVVIPFSRSAQSVEEFHAAYDHIVRRIEERGHSKPPRVEEGPSLDAGGVDRSSRHLTQLFYWPCTNAAFPDAAFFRSCALRSRSYGADQTKVEAAIRQWREVGCAPGNGNDAFYRLGRRLAYAGMDDYEISAPPRSMPVCYLTGLLPKNCR